MFTVGYNNDKVYEYALSTAFDVSSSSLSFTDSLSISSQEQIPTEIRFNLDGTKMYITGNEGRDINEYTLSTAFDISSTVTHKGSYSLTSSDSYPTGFSFNNDGTKLFTTGANFDRVNEHSLTTPFSLVDVSGEHSGDVINTSNTDTYDTDPDSDTLTVTAIRTGSVEGSGTAGSVGSALTGSYGNLTIAANGSYTYVVADNSTLDALDAGDTVTDIFNYTVSDGQGETDIATITISIVGINDAPTAVADTDTVTANATVTDTTNSAGTLVSDDTDADASSSLYITQVTPSGGSATSLTYNSTKTSNAATITGSKGTLTIGSDGSYSYAANLNVTTGPDTFTYTLTDGTSTTTSTLTIDVVVNHFGYIQEGKTLTVANTGSLVSGTSTGSNTGDIVYNDTSDTYTVTQIQHSGAGSATAVTDVTYSHGSATSVSGTYGTLTIGSDGSYQYVANSNISGVNAGGSNVTDTFTYTEDTGSGTNTKTLTIYVIPSQDLTARNDTGTINEGATLTVSDGDNETSVATATFSSSNSYNTTYPNNSSDVIFNDDGTKMYVPDSYTGYVYQYSLSTAFDVSSASYLNYYVSGVTAQSMSFNNDGTKLFLLTANQIREYSVSTAFDTSSTVSLTTYTSLSSQESSMSGFAFNNDGTKMFTVGYNNDKVYEYALSTAFDVSSSSLSFTDSLSISSQEQIPTEIRFNLDGTKMYITGNEGRDINEYTLSTAFDISSTVTHKGSYSLTSSDSYPTGFSFNNDGTKLFTTGANFDRVNEHSLTTPFSLVDVSGEHSGDVINTSNTDTYDTDPDSDTLTVTAIRTGSVEGSGTAGSVGSALTGSYGNLTIAANGSYTYVVADNSTLDALDAGDTVTDIFNYTVSDGQGETDIATITISIVGINDAPTAVADTDTVTANATVTDTTNSAGTLVSDDTDADASSSLYITQVTPSGGSATSLTYNSTKTSNAATITGSKGTLTIGSDGSYSYAANLNVTTGPDTFTYTLTDGTSTTTSTLTIDVVVNHFGYIQEGKTLTVANTGSLVSGTSTGSNTGDIVYNDTSDTYTVTQIQHSGAGSATAVTDVTYSHGSATSVSGTYGTLTIGSDGSYQYVANSNISGVNAGGSNVTDTFTYTEDTGSGTNTKTLTIYVIPSQDLTARNDTGTINEGATLTVSDGDNETSVATATFSSSNSYNTTYPNNSSDVIFNDDGTKMYVPDNNTGYVYQYSLSTAFDVSSASYLNYYVSGVTAQSMSFNNDGTKLFLLTANQIREYSVSTAFDTSSTVSLTTYTSLSSQESSMSGFAFNNDGTKMFTVGYNNDKVYEYALSTAFDVSSSSLSFTDSLSISSQEQIPTEIRFNLDGTKMYITGNEGRDINEYTLSTAFDISSTVTHKGSYSLTSSDSYPTGFSFNNDGTKLFTTGANFDRVNEHSLTTPFSLVDVSGEHSGDVINTSNTDTYDTDPDSDTLTVTAIRTGSVEGSGTAGSVGSALTGSYGNLTIAANGSYTYVVADNSTLDALDAGDTVTDIFNYTVSDGQGETDIATITISIVGINDAPTAVADTDTVTACNATVTDTTNSAGTLVSDDTDADASSSLYITQVTPSGGSATSLTYNSTKTSNAATITGSKGTLTIGSDGSYSYAANSDATSGTDVFTYTLTDGTSTTTSTLTITVINNNAPSAVADTGYIQEGKTLTVADGATANDADSSSNNNDATGDHTGDILGNDTDADSDSLTITTYTHTSSAGQGGANTTPGSPASGTAGTDSVAGTYGTLDLEANGSYTYTASSNITNLDVDDETFTDVFTYTVSDGNGGTDTATITITIEASGDVTARNDTGTVNEDGTLTVSNGGNVTSITSASFVDDGANDPFEIHTQDGSPVGIRFNNDGTKLFMVGEAGRDINEYALSTAFDISTSSYTQNYDLTSQENGPRDVAFNSDGTKMFIIGNDNNTIELHEYALSTAYSLSSVSHTTSIALTSKLPSGSQDTDAYSIEFNTDGTKFFISGRTNNNIYEFTVSSGFNLTSTVAYDSAFDISGEAAKAQNIRFNNDGTKLFVADNDGDDINEYTLTTGFDISTASHKGSFSVASQDTVPVGLDFNNDGTKMFVAGWAGDDINEYTLTSPFSLVNVSGENTGDVIDTSSTDNYDTDPDSDTLTVTAIRTGSVEGSGTSGTVGGTTDGTYGTLTINSNGSYTYVADKTAADALDAGDTVTDIFNYTVSDGQGETDIATITITIVGINDAPTAVADTDSVDAGSTVTDTTNSAGTLVSDDTDADASSSLYVTKITHTNGNSSNVTYNSTKTSNAATIVGSKGTLTFGSDGSYSYAANSNATSGTDAFTYTLTDGTSTTTATLTITINNNAPSAVEDTGYIQEGKTLTVANSGSAVSGTSTGSNTGDITDNDTDADSDTLTVTQIQHSGAGSATAVTDVTYSHGSATSVNGNFGTLTIGSDGSYQYVANSNISGVDAGGSNVTDVFTYTVSDGNGGTDTENLTINVIPSQDLTARNDTGTINEDATLTVSDGDNATSVTGVSQDTGSPYTSNEGTVRSVAFNDDGTKMFVIHHAEQSKISEHALTTAFDINTASQSTTYNISYNDARGIRFNNDGSKFYISYGHGTNKKIYEYSLSTNYDISSLPTPSETVISGQDSGPRGFTFNTDGTKMFLLGDTNHHVYEYSLSTAFDTTTISYTSRSLDFSSRETTPRGIAFNSTGTKLFIIGQSSDSILEYDLSTGFNLSTATFNGAFSLASFVNKPNDIAFNNDGSKLFLARANSNAVLSFSLSSPYSFVDITGEHSGDVIDTSSTDNYDTDPDSDTLTVTAIRTGSVEGSGTSGTVGGTTDGTYGTLTINSNGSYTYVADKTAADALDAGDTVTDIFNYTVSDGQGETDIATITITIVGINDAPTAVADTDSVDAGSTVTDTTNSAGTLVSDDTDADASSSLYVTKITHTNGNSSNVTYNSTKTSNAATIVGSKGTLTFGSDGSYSYAANSNAASGTDAFTYTLTDGTSTTTATLTITINNNAPTVVNDTDSVTEGGTVIETTNSAGTVLSDDSDVDGDSLTVSGTVTQTSATDASGSSITISSPNSASVGSAVTGYYGQLTLDSDGTYSYVANQSNANALDSGESGTDVFTFTVSDGTTTTSSTITFTVNGANDAPTVVNDTDSVTEGGTVIETTNSAGTVLSDDSDVDGDSLTVSGTVTQTSATDASGSSITISSPNSASVGSAVTGYYGQLTLDSDGTYSYVANQSNANALDSGESGTDVFTFTVSDGTTTTSSTITFTVNGANDAPTVVNDTDSVTEGGTVIETTNSAGTVLSDDSDVDGDSLTVSGTVTQTSATDANVEVPLQSAALTVHLLDLQLQVITAN